MYLYVAHDFDNDNCCSVQTWHHYSSNVSDYFLWPLKYDLVDCSIEDIVASVAFLMDLNVIDMVDEHRSFDHWVKVICSPKEIGQHIDEVDQSALKNQ